MIVRNDLLALCNKHWWWVGRPQAEPQRKLTSRTGAPLLRALLMVNLLGHDAWTMMGLFSNWWAMRHPCCEYPASHHTNRRWQPEALAIPHNSIMFVLSGETMGDRLFLGVPLGYSGSVHVLQHRGIDVLRCSMSLSTNSFDGMVVPGLCHRREAY